MRTATGYRATRKLGNDGEFLELTIHAVPIFLEGFREQHPDVDFDGRYDLAWLRKALTKAKARQKDDYNPPMHVLHHDPGVTPEAAGTFRITGIETITFRGKPRKALMADMIFTNEWVADRAVKGQLPFRSVEINNVEKYPSIDTLALLDSEAPFYELPNLRVADVEDHTEIGVGPTTTARQWSIERPETSAAMVAFRRQGTTEHVLFRDEPMATKTKTKEKFGAGVDGKATRFDAHDDDEKDKNKLADDDDDEKKDEMEDGDGADMAACIKAIKDGTISFADFQALRAAMDEMESTGDDIDDTELPADATLPGASAMKAAGSASQKMVAEARGEARAAKSDVAQLRAEIEREKDVEAALKRLELVGSEEDLRAEFTAEHKNHGPSAFKSYVGAIAKHVGVASPERTDGAEKEINAKNFSAVALKIGKEDPDRVAEAEGFQKQWAWSRENGGGTTLDVETYVEIRMEKAAATRAQEA